MIRITFTSPDFADFESAAHDDHVKLFFPSTQAGETDSAARDFTPRRFDQAQRSLAIDFVLHDHGPATAWARNAHVGDTLTIGGPRGSTVVADDFDWYLLIGDESALPAIGRRIEELRRAVPVTTVILVADAGEQQSFATVADWRPQWLHRNAEGDEGAAILRVLDRTEFPGGDGFVWIAAETAVARAVRRYVIEDRGHPAAWVKAAAYWTRGRAGEKESIDGPT